MATQVDPFGVEPRAILDAVEFRGRSVLEVGAADGRLTFQYAEEPKRVVGIDTKEADIRSAMVAGDGGRLQFLCASAMALPFPGEQFDIVLFASSL